VDEDRSSGSGLRRQAVAQTVIGSLVAAIPIVGSAILVIRMGGSVATWGWPTILAVVGIGGIIALTIAQRKWIAGFRERLKTKYPGAIVVAVWQLNVFRQPLETVGIVDLPKTFCVVFERGRQLTFIAQDGRETSLPWSDLESVRATLVQGSVRSSSGIEITLHRDGKSGVLRLLVVGESGREITMLSGERLARLVSRITEDDDRTLEQPPASVA
jgi:hypothetical protein